MKAQRIRLVLAISSLGLGMSCGGTSSDSSASSCPNLAGTWTLVAVEDATKCGGATSTRTEQAVVTQSGCSFVLAADTLTVTGNASGAQLSGNSQTKDSDGVASGTFTATLSSDGNSANGTDTWTFNSASKSCSGTTQIIATRSNSPAGTAATTPSGFAGAGGGAFGTSDLARGGNGAGNVGLGGTGGSPASMGTAAAGTVGNLGLCSLVGSFPARQANHTVVSANYAFVAKGSLGIEILDVSNPAMHKSVGALPTTNAMRLAVNGTSLYVADGRGGLKVVDVSVPATPKLIATPALPGSGPLELKALALSGNKLYGGYLGLNVFDVSAPAAPAAVAAVGTTFVEDIVIEGSMIYAATADGLGIYSTLSPMPFLAGSLDTLDWGQALASSAGYVFYGGDDGLSVVDVSSPAMPALVSSTGSVASIRGLALHGSHLYVNGTGSGLSVFDVADPKTPKLLGKCGDTATAYRSMTIVGDLGYIAAGDDGIIVLKLAPLDPSRTIAPSSGSTVPVEPERRSTCNFVGAYRAPDVAHVIAGGDYAYVAEGYNGIEILDVTDPTHPKGVGAISTMNATELALNGTALYVADDNGGMKIIDVSSPASPKVVGTPILPGTGMSTVQTLALDGSVLYAASTAFCILDVTNPTTPKAMASLDAAFIASMAVDGSLVYAATIYGVDVYSVASMSKPVRVGSYSTSNWGSTLVAAGGYVYYGSPIGLTVVDVTTPSAPRFAASMNPLETITGLTVRGNYLYVSAKGPGLDVLDISNPTSPKAAGKCGELAVGTPQRMSVSGQHGYVANGQGGVVILALTL